MSRVVVLAAIGLVPAIGRADQTMPQMDFRNPLTFDQLGWMVVIVLALYLVLSRWGLPQIGKVLERRDSTIQADLAAARAAKTRADEMVADMSRTLAGARGSAQAEIAQAVHDARMRAREDALALEARLEAQLQQAESQISAARNAALAAIKPVAADTAATILTRLTGYSPDIDALSAEVDTALAARAA